MRSKWIYFSNALAVIAILSMLVITCNNKRDMEIKKGYKLVWNDEFDYSGLPDSLKWNYDTVGNSWGWGNNELQFYTFKRNENAWVSDGTLKLKAIKEDYNGFGYTSARLTTKGKGDWLYGRYEISAKLPDGRGLWPAIWMLSTDWEYGGWPESGEIDIMENVGYNPSEVFATVHTANFNHMLNTQIGSTIEIADDRENFHCYALEWNENKLDFFVDDSLYFTFNKESQNPNDWPFDKRFHLLVNLAVGGNLGGKEGVDDAIFPAVMEVDYVRVFARKK